MKILVSTGIRSDYDILYPVLSELKKANHELLIVASGAHLSDNHNNTYKRIIKDGFNGFLTPPGDIDALYGRINKLYKDNKLRDKFSKNARIQINKNFSPLDIETKLDNVYKSFLR